MSRDLYGRERARVLAPVWVVTPETRRIWRIRVWGCCVSRFPVLTVFTRLLTTGERPNLIPAAASLHINIRSKHAPTLRALSRRVEEVLRGAAPGWREYGGDVGCLADDHAGAHEPHAVEALGGSQRSVGRHPYPPEQSVTPWRLLLISVM